jgi:dephospho-CoA kinase
MVIGLTGGIGSGKTTVANFFEEMGIPVYVADLQAKSLMENSEEIHQELIQLFGTEVMGENGLPNRKWIAEKVFKDKILLENLNQIIHPKVAEDFKIWKEKQKAPYVIYEAAIIFEKNLQKRFDMVILVTAPEKEKIKRVMARDNSTREEVEARMQNQWSDKEKKKLANFTINNDDLKKTKLSVMSHHKILLSLLKT